MDCWDVLDIERFSDKKTIKIAYAKQLKLHRPDDDPEGFKQVHRAYKAALCWVPEAIDDRSAWMRLEDEPSDEALTEVLVDSLKRPFDDIAINTAEVEAVAKAVPVEQPILTELDLNAGLLPERSAKQTLSDEDKQLLEEISDQDAVLSNDWQTLYDQVNQIIRSNTRCTDPQQWTFLESLGSMRDLEFRKAASDKVFEVVAEANATSLENKHLHINKPVLNYLNEQFAWDKKWQEYQQMHSRACLNAVYPYLSEAEKPVKGISKKRELYYYRRGLAFAVDCVIFIIPFILFLIFDSVLAANGYKGGVRSVDFNFLNLGLFWVGAYVLFVVPFQESSRHQATLGKRLLKLQVVNASGDRIGFLQALWRSVLTVLCCVLFKVVVFINAILSYWRAEVLQDTLSRSYVELRPGYVLKVV